MVDEKEILREKPRVPAQGGLTSINIILLDPLLFCRAKYFSAKSLSRYTFSFDSQGRHVPTCYV